MKEYIFLFRGGKTDSATDAQIDAHELAWDRWMDALEQEDLLIDGLPMKDHAVIVNSSGSTSVQLAKDSDVSGYLILHAPDMDAAVEMAQDCPIFDFGGSIEVRELDSELDSE